MTGDAGGEKARRHARLDALSDHQRAVLLSYLCGVVPEDVDMALGFIESLTADTGGEPPATS